MKPPIALSYYVTLSMPRPGGSYCTGKPTLAEALAEAFSMATFYLSDRGPGSPGYNRVDVTIGECCAACAGTGAAPGVAWRRGRKPKCKACKGTGADREVVRTTFTAYDNGGRDYVTMTMRERALEAVSP